MVKVGIHHTQEGYFLYGNDRKVGPFSNLNEADLLDVAASLSGKTGELEELNQLLDRSVEASVKGDKLLDLNLTTEYSERIRSWPVHPKNVLKAKLLQWTIEEKPAEKKMQPTCPQSVLAVCFKKRYFDIGDCFAFDCPYWDWCLLQLKAIKEGAVLLLYEKNPLKCGVCHRRLATKAFYVKRGPKEPNSLFLVCDGCTEDIPKKYLVLEVQSLE
jgi:hypothetical protein